MKVLMTLAEMGSYTIYQDGSVFVIVAGSACSEAYHIGYSMLISSHYPKEPCGLNNARMDK
jgi:hypothetical protein